MSRTNGVCLIGVYVNLEQCCIANGVPQRCIGLCIEEQDTVTDRFLSICDQFETVIENCTGENIVLQGGN